MELKKWIKDLGITVQGQDVFFGEKKAYTLKEGQTNIPTLWCVRVDDPGHLGEETIRHFWQFVTGFDLLETRQMCWLGPIQLAGSWDRLPMCETYHSSFREVFYILDNFCNYTKGGKDWKFIQEEPRYNDYYDGDDYIPDYEGHTEMIEIFEDHA